MRRRTFLVLVVGLVASATTVWAAGSRLGAKGTATTTETEATVCCQDSVLAGTCAPSDCPCCPCCPSCCDSASRSGAETASYRTVRAQREASSSWACDCCPDCDLCCNH